MCEKTFQNCPSVRLPWQNRNQLEPGTHGRSALDYQASDLDAQCSYHVFLER